MIFYLHCLLKTYSFLIKHGSQFFLNLFFFCCIIKKNFIEVQLIYNVVLISAVQQSDSIIHMYALFFNILLSHYGLS